MKQAILEKVPAATIREAWSDFDPTSEALKISHDRAPWTLEVVPLGEEFFICFSRSLVLFSQDGRFDNARRGLSETAVDWVAKTVERAFGCGALAIKRKQGAIDIFLGDEVDDIKRELKSGAEIVRRFPAATSTS